MESDRDCNDCLNKATGTLVIDNYVVHVCDECRSLHQVVQPVRDEHDDINLKEDIREPWETKIRPFYTIEQRSAYIREKYVKRTFQSQRNENDDQKPEDRGSAAVIYHVPVASIRREGDGPEEISDGISVKVVIFRQSENRDKSYVHLTLHGNKGFCTFDGPWVRYACLVPSDEKIIYVSIHESFGEEDYSHSFFVIMKNYEDAFTLLNMIRRLVYTVKGASSNAIVGINELDADVFLVCRDSFLAYCLCIIDRECLWLYRRSPIGCKAESSQVLLFHDVTTTTNQNVVQAIDVNEDGKSIRIRSRTHSFTLRKCDSDLGQFDLFGKCIEYLHENRFPATAFRDPDAFAAKIQEAGPSGNLLAFSERQKEFGNVSLFDVIGVPDSPRYARMASTSAEDVIVATGHPAGHTRQGSLTPTFLSSDSDFERYFGQLVDGAAETMEFLWIMAEAEIAQLEKEGLVPESTIASGGLSPESFDHFKKCGVEIEEAIYNQQYDEASSLALGLQEVYRSSRNKCFRWLANHDLIPMLKLIFLAGANEFASVTGSYWS